MATTRTTLGTVRLLVEIVCAVAAAEFVVMVILPLVAAGVHGTAEAALDAAMLSIIAGPIILWRVRAAMKRAASETCSARSVIGRRPAVISGLVMTVGSALAVVAAAQIQHGVLAEARARFERMASREAAEVETRVNSVVTGLKGARGVYAASKSVERGEFRSYVASRDLAGEFPGALGFGFIKRVMRTDLQAFIGAERADEAPEFAVHGSPGPGTGLANAPDLYVVTFIEPLAANRPAWGFDVGTDPARRSAIERAIASGEPTITARIALLQDGRGGAGFLYYLPVYRRGTHPATPAERLDALDGVVYAPIVLEETLAGLGDFHQGQLDVELFGGEATTTDTLLCDRDGDLAGVRGEVTPAHDAERLFHTRRPLAIGGQNWTAVVRSSRSFEALVNRWMAPSVGLVGVLLAVLVGVMVWTMGTGRARATALAEAMTHDLKASEQRLRAILDAEPECVKVLDLHGTLRDMNPAGLGMLEADSVEQVCTLGLDHFVLSEHRAAFHALHERASRGEQGTLTFEIVGLGGTRRWLDTHAVPIRDAAGRVTAVIAVTRDVTALHRAEAATQAAHADARRLAVAVDAHADAVFLTDASGIIVRVNPAFERLTGYSASEAVGRPASLLKSGCTAPETYAELWATIRSGRPWTGRLKNRRKPRATRDRALPVIGQVHDAEPRAAEDLIWVDASITPITDENGSVQGYVAVQRDATELVRHEDEAARQLEGAQARVAVAKVLARSGPLGGRFDDCLELIFGMKGLDVQRKGGVFRLDPGEEHLRMLTHRGAFSDDFLRDEAAVPLGRCLCGRAAESGEVIVSDDCFTDHRHEHRWPGMKPHGHYIVPLMDRTDVEARCVGVLFLYTDPHPPTGEGRLGALREIGELMTTAVLQDRASRMMEAARVQAEAASRAKGEFLANMSHEIRTPLTAILGFAELLREDGDIRIAPEQRLQTIDTIRNAGQHLLTVINDILDLSKIEANRIEVEAIDTPLVSVLHEVTGLMGSRAKSKGVELTVSLATPVPNRIISDPTRLRQILMNLVGNAVKFTQQGSVRIVAGVTPGGASAGDSSGSGSSRLVIDVVDTGPGMTPAQAQRLFMAFSQADTTVTRQHGGTGLGLTISRRLAALMGGDVTLAATEPGSGSTFRLELPLQSAAGAESVNEIDVGSRTVARAQSEGVITLAGRILLAEDGVDNQRLIAFHLRKAGATVEIAENGLVALTMLDEAHAMGTPYDMLLTDMQMPEMDGYTLARTLRTRGCRMPIVALTAHAMAEDRAKCTEAGCDDYATKPIDKTGLLAVCSKWMGRVSQAPERRVA